MLKLNNSLFVAIMYVPGNFCVCFYYEYLSNFIGFLLLLVSSPRVRCILNLVVLTFTALYFDYMGKAHK